MRKSQLLNCLLDGEVYDRAKEGVTKAKCLLFQAARQSCASAGSYAQCMSIRWGEDWMSQQSRCQ